MLEVLEEDGARRRQLRGGATQQLLHGLGAPDEFAAADGAGFVDQGADLETFLRIWDGGGVGWREGGGGYTRRGFMAREMGVSHCLHLATRQFAKSGRPQLRIDVRWEFSRSKFWKKKRKKKKIRGPDHSEQNIIVR